MKKKFSLVSDKVKVIGINRMQGSKEVIDFYLVHPKWGREYAFTRKYTKNAYDLVKGGMSVKQLLRTKSKDRMVMRLVSYLSFMMPYFMEEIAWMAA